MLYLFRVPSMILKSDTQTNIAMCVAGVTKQLATLKNRMLLCKKRYVKMEMRLSYTISIALQNNPRCLVGFTMLKSWKDSRVWTRKTEIILYQNYSKFVLMWTSLIVNNLNNQWLLITKFKFYRDVTQNEEENNNEPPEKKIKTGTINDVNQIIEKKAKDQNKDFSVLRDRLKMRLTKEDFVTILTHNGQYVPKDESVRLYWWMLLSILIIKFYFLKR